MVKSMYEHMITSYYRNQI